MRSSRRSPPSRELSIICCTRCSPPWKSASPGSMRRSMSPSFTPPSSLSTVAKLLASEAAYFSFIRVGPPLLEPATRAKRRRGTTVETAPSAARGMAPARTKRRARPKNDLLSIGVYPCFLSVIENMLTPEGSRRLSVSAVRGFEARARAAWAIFCTSKGERAYTKKNLSNPGASSSS